MDDRFIDIILFAAIAIFLAYRLWSVLGQHPDDGAAPPSPRERQNRDGQNRDGQNLDVRNRDRNPNAARRPGAGVPGAGHGHAASGRPAGRPVSGRSVSGRPVSGRSGWGRNPAADPDGNNVVALPARGGPPALIPRPADPLAAGLAEISAADPSFQLDVFLDGARHAFELIVKGYAEGDTPTLRPLLSDEVYDAFAEGIRARMRLGETVETRVTRFQDPPRAVAARMEGRTAYVTVRFASSQISVTRDANGQIVEGDPERAVDRIDTWTFSRNTRSLDPNWVLVETEAEA